MSTQGRQRGRRCLASCGRENDAGSRCWGRRAKTTAVRAWGRFVQTSADPAAQGEWGGWVGDEAGRTGGAVLGGAVGYAAGSRGRVRVENKRKGRGALG